MKDLEQKRQRRSQRDYNLSFKLSVVSEVEKGDLSWLQAQRKYGIQGKSTVLVWLRKLGTLDWSLPKVHDLSSKEQTPEQRIKELEAALEKEKQKNLLLSTVIDIAEKQYGLSIRKKPLPKQPDAFKKKGK